MAWIFGVLRGFGLRDDDAVEGCFIGLVLGLWGWFVCLFFYSIVVVSCCVLVCGV